ncbi:CHAT domain-containing protein [Pantanalinema sp. GBBB05]|uniref:CHAT domain-containing protein n=1 Tax=Pantanalinema sp. GBBB05 TaxID=2604139 RepID=UPI001DD61993|nr:CHAT domain-containing protein [Pantanalinema sp. GBBB05]
MVVSRLGWIVLLLGSVGITYGVEQLTTPAIALPSPAAVQVDPAVADRLFQQGVQQFQANQLVAAIALWQQALMLYQALQDQAAIATTLKNLSAASLASRDYPQAIGYLQQSLALARVQADQQTELAILMMLGDTYASQDHYAKAIEVYQHGLTLAQSQGNSQATAILLGNVAIAHKALGNYNQAIAANQQALSLLPDLTQPQMAAQVLNNLGNVYEALGDYDAAIVQYQHSLKLVRQIPDLVGESLALNNLGGVYANQGQYKQAIEVLQQSLKISQHLKQPERQASTLINLGSAYHALDQREQAISFYQQALDLAQSMGDRRRASEALGSLGLIYEQLKEFPQAIQFQEQSLAMARQLGDPAAIGRGLNNLGHTLFKAGRLPEAEAQLRAAVRLLDALRPELSDRYQVSIFDTQVHTYSLLQQILLAANQPEAALEAAEQGRARAFVELLAKKDRAIGSKQRIPNRPVAAAITIAEIRQIAQQQKATLVEYAIVADDDFTFRGKQRAREAQLLIWVVQPTGTIHWRQVNLRPLWQKDLTLSQLVTAGRCLVPINDCEELGDRLRDTLPPAPPRSRRSATAGSRTTAAEYPGLRKLHELLVAPIADLLPVDPADRVIFIPQESLFLLPFPALQAPDGSYLIEHHTILTAPSIQVLALTQQLQQERASSPQTAALVVGNPLMPTVRLTPTSEPFQLSELPGAEQEAIAIAKLLHTDAVLGKQATKTQVLQQLARAKLAHLATHGLLEYGTQESSLQGIGMPGAIALAPSGEDDGLLTASEIANLRLQADLVVLSACDTGQGRITGDGVIGLSRALITAGVPSVIVSLWAVDDNSTSTLMQAFYRTLPTVTDKAQALRQAMLLTMKEHPSPMDWAAFTLIGEAEAGR